MQMSNEEEIKKYRERLKPYIDDVMAKLESEHRKNVFKAYLRGKKG
jgi:hypothetical protein